MNICAYYIRIFITATFQLYECVNELCAGSHFSRESTYIDFFLEILNIQSQDIYLCFFTPFQLELDKFWASRLIRFWQLILIRYK